MQEPFVPHPYSMKLGRLKEFLAAHPDLPDDTAILIERVEDVYFKDYGWKTVNYVFDRDGIGQNFFEVHCPSLCKDNHILIHAHY